MLRRNFLQIGSVGGIGLTLGNYNTLKAQDQVSDNAKAKSVIYIYLPGGFAAQETFDPKPLAPVEYRGPMNSIPTKIPGIRFNEHLKKTADIADKISVIRSMTHGETAHERGEHDMLTGWKPSAALVYPSIGSVISHELGVRNDIPPYIAIPKIPNEWADAGYLSQAYNPFSIGSSPEDPNFKVRDLTLPNGVTKERCEDRKRLLNIVNNKFIQSNESSDNLRAMNSFYDHSFSMLDNKSSTEAFDLNKENDKTKDSYGRNSAGMRMLLARRLVEAGSRFVTLSYGGWDMHQNIENGIKNNVPALDQAFAALINDLDDRGMLDSTLVMIGTEFGRTPKINQDSGRDHWPKAFSIVMAGGGVKRGMVYGETNSIADDIFENPVKPEDWGATVFDLVGIDYENVLYAPGDRPVKIMDGGKPIKSIMV